eukprot:764396_1
MAEDCSDLPGIVYNIYVLPTITGLAAVSIIFVMFLYINAHKKGALHSPNELYIAGIVFFTTTLLFYIAQTNKLIFYCHNPSLSGVFRAVGVQIYCSVQMLVLLGILFYRMIIVFTNTTFALSNATIKCFGAIYIFTWIILILHAILFSTFWISDSLIVPYTAYVVVAVAGSLCIVVLNALLIYLFVYKLVRTFQTLTTNRDNLLHLITKTSLLFLVSAFTLLLFTISQPLRTLDSIHWDFVCSLIVIADVYTNFMCIFLSYEFVDNYYEKICGCCHRKCYGFCSTCITKDDKNMPRVGSTKVVSSNVSQSSASGPQSSSPQSTEMVDPEI